MFLCATGGTRIASPKVTLPEHWCHLVRIGEDLHVGSTDTEQPIVAGLNRAINAGSILCGAQLPVPRVRSTNERIHECFSIPLYNGRMNTVGTMPA